MTSTTTLIRVVGNKNQTPGPGSYNIPSDFGSAPKWTIKNRYKEKKKELSPGYHSFPNSIGTGRKSTIANRPKERDFTQSPGPSYMPPKFGNDAQKSSFHGYTDYRGKRAQTPGPGQYDISKDLGGPKFTIKARKFPPDQGEIPGPGVGRYAPDYSKTMRASTSSSIRPRYKDPLMREKKPGPADYEVPRNLSNRSSCFHIKSHEFLPEPSPGPKYNNPGEIGRDSPKYSIRSRIDVKKEKLDPALNALPEMFGKEAHAYTIGVKSKERDLVQSPGPEYIPPGIGTESPKWSMTSRRERKRDLSLEPPGPGQYSPQTDDMSRKWTIATRAVPPDPKNTNPGPSQYDPNYTLIRRSTQMTAIREKFKERPPEPQPGYVDLGSTLTGPKWTIGVREEVDCTEGIDY